MSQLGSAVVTPEDLSAAVILFRKQFLSVVGYFQIVIVGKTLFSSAAIILNNELDLSVDFMNEAI